MTLIGRQSMTFMPTAAEWITHMSHMYSKGVDLQRQRDRRGAANLKLARILDAIPEPLVTKKRTPLWLTTAVSDLYFIGFHLGVVETRAATVASFGPDGVVTDDAQLLHADLIITCAPPELRSGTESMLGTVARGSIGFVDDTVWVYSNAPINRSIDAITPVAYGLFDIAARICRTAVHNARSPQVMRLVQAYISRVSGSHAPLS